MSSWRTDNNPPNRPPEINEVMFWALAPLVSKISSRLTPESVALVSPEDFAKVFGEGYEFLRLSIEPTHEEKPNQSIREILPWLSDFPEPPLCEYAVDLDKTEYLPCENLHHGDFIALQN